jgi:hypothetical protein
MSVLDRLLERIEKWKLLLELYHRYLHYDETDLEGVINGILYELGHIDCIEDLCSDFMLDDYYYDPQCIKHIIKELETVVKWLQERGLS